MIATLTVLIMFIKLVGAWLPGTRGYQMGQIGKRANIGWDFLISVYYVLWAERCTYPTAEHHLVWLISSIIIKRRTKLYTYIIFQQKTYHVFWKKKKCVQGHIILVNINDTSRTDWTFTKRKLTDYISVMETGGQHYDQDAHFFYFFDCVEKWCFHITEDEQRH